MSKNTTQIFYKKEKKSSNIRNKSIIKVKCKRALKKRTSIDR